MKLETKVGIFVVIAIAMLFALTTQVGSLKFGNTNGYPISIIIDNANGLEKNAKIKSRGITIGYVDSFSLNSSGVMVNGIIEEQFKIPNDSIVSIKQESLLGVKYVDIEFSNSKKFLVSNGTLTKNKSYASFDEMSETINEAAISFKQLTSRLDLLIEKNEKNITELVSNFKDVGSEFKQTGIELNKKLPSILEKFESVGEEFTQTGKILNKDLPKVLNKFDSVGREFTQTGVTINEKLPRIMDKFEAIEDKVDAILVENKSNLKSAIENVDKAFESVDKAAVKVESSFDKLDTFLSSTTQSTLGIEMKADYFKDDEISKTHFVIDYSPKPTVHYLFDVVGMDDYRDDGTGNPVATDKHEKGRTVVSAQYGKDIGRFRFRGGFIESTGGIGIDYFSKNRKLKYTLDAYDFNAYNDIRGDSAHLRAALEYTMKKHILFYTGYDNFLNDEARNLYFGIGVKFEDNDLKYLLGSSAASFR